MAKYINKFTIIINVIAFLAIIYYIFAIPAGGGSLYGTDYLFGINFLIIIYLVTFIHLFCYPAFKDKLTLASLDLLPIFLFGVLVTVTQETDISTIAQDIAFVTLVFYIFGGIWVLLSNYSIHKIYFKLKTSKRISKNYIKKTRKNK